MRSVARLGGDEFAALFPTTGYSGAQEILQKVQQQLHEVMEQHGWPVTVSIGAVTVERPTGPVQALLTTASQLMYIVKRHGKNNLLHEVWQGSSPHHASSGQSGHPTEKAECASDKLDPRSSSTSIDQPTYRI